MFRCEHEMDYCTLLDYDTCSTCKGVDDSSLDDAIAAGQLISRVHPQVVGHAKTPPTHTLHMRSWLNGVERVRAVPARLPDTAPLPATHEPEYPQAWVPWSTWQEGYAVEVVEAADVDELRVRECVRDFGLLVSNRDVEYATAIGLDWDGFVAGVVAPEADHLAAEGAGLPIPSPSSRAIRPTGKEGISAWRKGRAGAVGWGVEVGA